MPADKSGASANAGGLNPKQQRFVQEYLIDLNATQAAIRAGYSKKTANEQAAQLLAKLSVAEAVITVLRSALTCLAEHYNGKRRDIGVRRSHVTDYRPEINQVSEKTA